MHDDLHITKAELGELKTILCSSKIIKCSGIVGELPPEPEL